MNVAERGGGVLLFILVIVGHVINTECCIGAEQLIVAHLFNPVTYAVHDLEDQVRSIGLYDLAPLVGRHGVEHLVAVLFELLPLFRGQVDVDETAGYESHFYGLFHIQFLSSSLIFYIYYISKIFLSQVRGWSPQIGGLDIFGGYIIFPLYYITKIFFVQPTPFLIIPDMDCRLAFGI